MNKDNLRPVEFSSRWGSPHIPVTKGYFHRWGEKLNYVTNTATSLYGAAEVVGIVETETGQVYEVPAHGIRFLDRMNK